MNLDQPGPTERMSAARGQSERSRNARRFGDPRVRRHGDSTVRFLLRGYRFIGEECDRAGGDVAEVRLLLRRTVLLRGTAAAELVYDPARFSRNGALPKRAQRTLTGVGGVQSLDGEEHRVRKALFVGLLDDAAVQSVTAGFLRELRALLPEWERRASVRLLDDCSQALCAAASDWAGLPVAATGLAARTRALRAMIESGAKLGPAHWAGLLARRGAEAALARVVGEQRRKSRRGGTDPLSVVSFHVDSHGELLAERVAAVELLNLLRPIVAVARYIVFAVHAVTQRPGVRTFLQRGGTREWSSFVSEVRRFYPFFPAVAAVALEDVRFGGQRIPTGRRVLLDLWGTNRGRDHEQPDRFDPGRFLERPGPFDLIPQGGGGVSNGHRCPGETLTESLVTSAIRVFLNELTFDAAPSHVPLRPIPTAPEAGLQLSSIRSVRAGASPS